MNEKTERNEVQDRDEKTMSRLLQLAGPQKPIPRDIEARVFERVEREWKSSTMRPERARVYQSVQKAWKRSRRISNWTRWVMPAAIAASALLVITILNQPNPVSPPVAPVGTVVRASGDPLPIGRRIFPGDVITTAAGEGVSLVLAHAESLRIDENTALRIDESSRFGLLYGRMYADTGDSLYRGRKLVVETPIGEVTDVGTQFSVATSDDLVEIAVREGRVDLDQQDEMLTAVAGERVRLISDSEPLIERVEPHDPYWNWASSLAPAYDLENRSLLDFLRWASRETGRELIFEDQELRMAAMRTDLHGTVADFEPLEAVESILATTSFKYRIERDRIIIER